MTRYVTLLFNRSMASRASIGYREKIKVDAIRQFLANETQIQTVATHWNLDAHFKGVNLSRLITTDDVKRAALRLKIFNDPVSSEQESYVTSIVSFMTYFDEKMFSGEWKLVGTTIEDPFIISDAPVVTWERTNSSLSFGVGFERPNVEVLLPVSPLTCLHILPKVPRTSGGWTSGGRGQYRPSQIRSRVMFCESEQQ